MEIVHQLHFWLRVYILVKEKVEGLKRNLIRMKSTKVLKPQRNSNI